MMRRALPRPVVRSYEPHPADPFEGPYRAGSPLNSALVRLAVAVAVVGLSASALWAFAWAAS